MTTKLVVSIYILVLLIIQITLPSSSIPLIKQLKEVINTSNQANGSLFTCTGMILAVDETFNQDFITEFANDFAAVPIVLLQSDNISTSSLEQQQDVGCYHLIHFTSQLLQFDKVMKKLKEGFYLKTVTAIVSEFDVKDAERLLENTQSEDVILIPFNNGCLLDICEVYQWGVDSHIRHYNSIRESINHRKISRAITSNNLMGRKLRVGTLHFPPAVFISNSSTATTVDGFEQALLNLLAYSLNFTIEYVFSNPSEMWGWVITLEDGRVEEKGLRGMLHRRQIDVAVGEFYIIHEWFNMFSYSEAFKTNYECFLVPSPKPYPRWMALILPFSLWTWIATFISLILAVLTLNFVAHLAKNNKDSYLRDGILSVLYVIGNMLNIQQPKGIHSMPNRLFIVAWLFAAVITSSAYRSGLFSFHTNPSSPPPIQFIKQLVENPINKASYNTFLINNNINSTDPHIRQLAQQLTPINNISQMFSLLDSGDWAVASSIDRLLYEAVLRYPNNSNEDPPFYFMKECILSTRAAFGLQKNSPLKPYFDRMILRFVETGLVKYHRLQYVKELRHQQRPITSKEMVPFSLDDLQGAFYLFACGVIISIVVFVIEWTVKSLIKITSFVETS